MGCARLSSLALSLAVCLFGAGAMAEAPQRVVSMNLCTDQLAMLLAAPGQLVSVSRIASDPQSSAMADEARAYPANAGRAEEIYLLQPDLVVAGTFSDPVTVDMLERLGVSVVRFPLVTHLEDVPKLLRQMGEVLGRETVAEARAAAFTGQLDAWRDDVAKQPRAALYYANGYSLGDKTLAGQILAFAGFRNVAEEEGLERGGRLPLERLVMAAPDLVVSGTKYPGASRSEAILDHPAFQALPGRSDGRALADRDWICGTPYVLNAVADMRSLRQDMTE